MATLEQRQVRCYVNGVFFQEFSVGRGIEVIDIIIPKPTQEQKANDHFIHRQAPIMEVAGVNLRADFNDADLCLDNGQLALVNKR